MHFEGRLKAVLVLWTVEEEGKVWRTQEGYLISLPVPNEPMTEMVCLEPLVQNETNLLLRAPAGGAGRQQGSRMNCKPTKLGSKQGRRKGWGVPKSPSRTWL